MWRMLLRMIHDLALMLDHKCNDREAVPSARVIDIQSVKALGMRTRGNDTTR